MARLKAIFLDSWRRMEVIFLLVPPLITFFSGVFFPIGLLPQWLRPLAWNLPFPHAIEATRGLLILGYRGGPWEASFRILLIQGIVLVGLGTFLLNRVILYLRRTGGLCS